MSLRFSVKQFIINTVSSNVLLNVSKFSQEISSLLWKKVYFRVQKCPPQSIPSRPALTQFSHLRLGLQSVIFDSGFPTIILYSGLISPLRVTYPYYIILLNLIITIIR